MKKYYSESSITCNGNYYLQKTLEMLLLCLLYLGVEGRFFTVIFLLAYIYVAYNTVFRVFKNGNQYRLKTLLREIVIYEKKEESFSIKSESWTNLTLINCDKESFYFPISKEVSRSVTSMTELINAKKSQSEESETDRLFELGPILFSSLLLGKSFAIILFVLMGKESASNSSVLFNLLHISIAVVTLLCSYYLTLKNSKYQIWILILAIMAGLFI